MMTCRAVFTLVAVAMAPALAACGGVKVPQHSGYKGKNPKPWEKAKEIKLGPDAKAKIYAELDYATYKRARWFAVQLPGPGDLSVELDVVPTGGAAPTEDDDEAQDLDVGIELLDPAFQVVAKSDLESEDAHSLKKTLTRKQLEAGRYLIHVYLHDRLDAADVELKLGFTRGAAVWKSDFPRQVEFVPALAAVSPVDDAPKARKPPKGGGGSAKPKPAPETAPAEAKGGSGGGKAVVAEITDTRPDPSGGVRIVIRAGTGDGMSDGFKGSVDGVAGSSFTLSGCTATTCRAVIRATIDAVRTQGRGTVTIRLK